MDKLMGLLRHRLSQGRIIMPQHIHGDAAEKIQVFLALHIPDIGALTVIQHYLVAVEDRQISSLVLHDDFLGNLLHVTFLLAHNLGADTFGCKEFEDDGMPQPAINDMGLARALGQGAQAGLHLRYHAACKHALPDPVLRLL